MPLRFDFCPHCNSKVIFRIEMEDINSKQYPAPVYIICNSCKKLSTFYFDSLLRVSYKEREKKPGAIKTIETN
ncbi:MAG: hypothetical protein ACFFDY_05430 [Candidatus Thorarchaeota archaeon]